MRAMLTMKKPDVKKPEEVWRDRDDGKDNRRSRDLFYYSLLLRVFSNLKKTKIII